MQIYINSLSISTTLASIHPFHFLIPGVLTHSLSSTVQLRCSKAWQGAPILTTFVLCLVSCSYSVASPLVLACTHLHTEEHNIALISYLVKVHYSVGIRSGWWGWIGRAGNEKIFGSSHSADKLYRSQFLAIIVKSDWLPSVAHSWVQRWED